MADRGKYGKRSSEKRLVIEKEHINNLAKKILQDDITEIIKEEMTQAIAQSKARKYLTLMTS